MRLAFTAALLGLAVTIAASARDAKPDRVFELRTYHVADGKLADLHTRFRDHTCELLTKHGAELIGFWTPTDEKDGKGKTLVYLVAHPSRDAATETWKAFRADPAWIQAKAASEADGPLTVKIESVFMEPTDYSATR